MRSHPRRIRRAAGPFVRRLGLAGLGLAVLFLLLEGGTRAVVARFANHSIEMCGRTGWRSRANHRYRGTCRDAAGVTHAVTVTTDENGFRAFGDIAGPRPKILFLGDSFTHAVQVSDDKTFYRQVGDALGVEVFACGVRGYGTLQELMLLEEWGSRIQPDVVVLQLCANDFINNSLELEQRSYLNNNGMVRPYYVADYRRTGEAVYANPLALPGIVDFAMQRSYFVYFVVSRLALREASRMQDRSIEREIDRRGMGMARFQDAIAVTSDLLGLFKERAGQAAVMAFNVTEDEPYSSCFRKLTEQHGIVLIEGVFDALRIAEQRGITTRAADGAHWSEAGHAVAGKRIADALREQLGSQGP